VLAVLDTVVIPFLQNLYGAVGYLGVFLAMVIESTLLPLPFCHWIPPKFFHHENEPIF